MRLQSRLTLLFLAMALLPLGGVVLALNNGAREVVLEDQLERRRAQSREAILGGLERLGDEVRVEMKLVLSGREVAENLLEPLENGTFRRDRRRHLNALLNLGAGHDVLYFLDQGGQELAVAHVRDTRTLEAGIGWFDGRLGVAVLRRERLAREEALSREVVLTLQTAVEITTPLLRQRGEAVYAVVGRRIDEALISQLIPPGSARIELLGPKDEVLLGVSTEGDERFNRERLVVDWPSAREGDLLQRLALELDVDGEIAQLARVNQAAVWLGSLSAALALLLAWFNARRIARPLAQLTESAGRVARGEDALEAIDGTGGYEVTKLSSAFQTMSEDLAQAEAQKLEAVRLAAYSRVAQRVGHEVKNPLTSVQLNLQYLRKVLDGEDGGYRDIFDESLKEVARIERIVSRFREVADETEVVLEEHDLGATLAALCTFHGQGECAVLYEGPTSASVWGDGDALRQAFTNLITNAVEACAQTSERPGLVRVMVTLTDAQALEVCVVDNGAGMTEETKESLFMPLYTTKTRGSGLGLSVTNRLIRLHRGRITVQSDLGVGSTFRVVLPRGKSNPS